jgi:proline iminopeptidase
MPTMFPGLLPEAKRSDLLANYYRRLIHERRAGPGRIEAHCFVNDVFLENNELLKNVRRLRHIPAILIQGRYDMVCPIVTADSLARAWPEAKYVIIPDAGHSAMEPGIRAALVRAAEAMKTRVG